MRFLRSRKENFRIILVHDKNDRVAADLIIRRCKDEKVKASVVRFDLGSFYLKHEPTCERFDSMIILLSSKANESLWIKQEITLTGVAEMERRGMTVFCVLVRPCPIPEALSGRILSNLYPDQETGLQQLITKVTAIVNLDLNKLNSGQFETLVAELLASLNYSVDGVHLRKRFQQQFDIFARADKLDTAGRKTDAMYLIECKKYGDERPNLASLSRLRQVISHWPGNTNGLLVTSGQLTSVARKWLAEASEGDQHKIQVIEGPELKRLLLLHTDILEKYFR